MSNSKRLINIWRKESTIKTTTSDLANAAVNDESLFWSRGLAAIALVINNAPKCLRYVPGCGIVSWPMIDLGNRMTHFWSHVIRLRVKRIKIAGCLIVDASQLCHCWRIKALRQEKANTDFWKVIFDSLLFIYKNTLIQNRCPKIKWRSLRPETMVESNPLLFL